VIAQMDAPSEIYARPSTLFVATFIGTMNRLDAAFDAEGLLRAGPFGVPPPDGLRSKGTDHLVAGVRPQRMLVYADGRLVGMSEAAPARAAATVRLVREVS
jgi:ABC-type sugar transport system ATPase subunit